MSFVGGAIVANRRDDFRPQKGSMRSGSGGGSCDGTVAMIDLDPNTDPWSSADGFAIKHSWDE